VPQAAQETCGRHFRRGRETHAEQGTSILLLMNLRDTVLELVWPDFNELGDLPVGVYRAKIADVIAHFGRGTAHA
jgi:hypothetical protein